MNTSVYNAELHTVQKGRTAAVFTVVSVFTQKQC